MSEKKERKNWFEIHYKDKSDCSIVYRIATLEKHR